MKLALKLRLKLPPNWPDYFYTGARIASVVLLVVGIVAFVAAVSFEGYLLALIALALAGCSFTGAQEIKANREPRANEQQGLAAMMPDDSGSSPGSAA